MAVSVWRRDRVERECVAHRMRKGVHMERQATQTNVPPGESPLTEAARERATSALGRLEHGERGVIGELREALCSYGGALLHEGGTREATLATVRTLTATRVTAD